MDNRIVNRFWQNVNVGGSDDCWNYKKSLRRGYGHFSMTHDTARSAHRFAWLITSGEIPDGMYVCHKCNNKSCCNPAHLYLADDKQNRSDAVRDGLYAVGERNGLSKLTEQKILEIRALDRERPQRGTRAWLAGIYGVSDTLISHICNRKIWKHI